MDSHVFSTNTVVAQWDLPEINLPTTTTTTTTLSITFFPYFSHMNFILKATTFSYDCNLKPYMRFNGARFSLPTIACLVPALVGV